MSGVVSKLKMNWNLFFIIFYEMHIERLSWFELILLYAYCIYVI